MKIKHSYIVFDGKPSINMLVSLIFDVLTSKSNQLFFVPDCTKL